MLCKWLINLHYVFSVLKAGELFMFISLIKKKNKNLRQQSKENIETLSFLRNNY